jgi:D-amino-acid dehydrogenase
MKVAVIGAGVSGVTTAYMLALRGCEVTLVDRAESVADETSYANGSVVGGTQIEPWAGPGLQWQLLKWIGKENAPLLVRWGQLPRIMGWGVRFLRNCGHRQFMKNLRTSGRLTRHSLKMFEQLRSEAIVEGQDYSLNAHGAIKVYHSNEAYEQACSEAETIAALGFDIRPVDRDGCVAQEPGLAPVAESLAGGVVYADEEIGNCREFTRTLAKRLESQGVELKLNTVVDRIERNGDRI